MHSAEFCCCGCSWKTGTVMIMMLSFVILFINIVVNLWSSVVHGPELQLVKLIVVLISTIFLIITASGLFGVSKKKPAWLIPFMTVQLLSLMGGGIAVMVGPSIIHLLVKTVALGEIKNILSYPVIIMVEIVLAIWTGFCYYSFVVVLSCYKQLKAEYSC